MDKKKVGKFLKELRTEKGLTKELPTPTTYSKFFRKDLRSREKSEARALSN